MRVPISVGAGPRFFLLSGFDTSDKLCYQRKGEGDRIAFPEGARPPPSETEMAETTDSISACDRARVDDMLSALLHGRSAAQAERLVRGVQALASVLFDDEERLRAPPPLARDLLDLEDALNAAFRLAEGLALAIEGLGEGSERDALGRIGEIVLRELAAVRGQVRRIRGAHPSP